MFVFDVETPAMTYTRYRALYDLVWDSYRPRIIAAHPETMGWPMLVSNWGNPEARRLMARCDRVSSYVLRRRDRQSSIVHHREHIHRQEVGRYLWCDYCQGRKTA